jgi:hypothetical protein
LLAHAELDVDREMLEIEFNIFFLNVIIYSKKLMFLAVRLTW